MLNILIPKKDYSSNYCIIVSCLRIIGIFIKNSLEDSKKIKREQNVYE